MAVVQNDNVAYLRLHLVRLVRVWAALSVIRRNRSDELIRVFQDVCSDNLRTVLHELANKEDWTLGFTPEGTDQHKRLFQRLVDANKWFEGKRGKAGKKKLHYRNASGAHLQPLTSTEHMFQQFGFGGDREWKHLTKGVAACIQMMKLIDGKKHDKFWREVRKRVVTGKAETHEGLPIPSAVTALLLDYKVR